MRFFVLALVALPAAAARPVVLPKAKPVITSLRAGMAPRVAAGSPARLTVPSPLAASPLATAAALSAPAAVLAPASEQAPLPAPGSLGPLSPLGKLSGLDGGDLASARKVFDGSEPMLKPATELWEVDGKRYASTAQLVRDLPASLEPLRTKARYRFSHDKAPAPLPSKKASGWIGVLFAQSVTVATLPWLWADASLAAAWPVLNGALSYAAYRLGGLVHDDVYHEADGSVKDRWPEWGADGRLFRAASGDLYFDLPAHEDRPGAVVNLTRYAEAASIPPAGPLKRDPVMTRDRGLGMGALSFAAGVFFAPILPAAAALIGASLLRVTDPAGRAFYAAVGYAAATGALALAGWPLLTVLGWSGLALLAVGAWGYAFPAFLRLLNAKDAADRAANPKGQWWSRPV